MISKFALKAVCTAAVVAGAALVAPAAHAGTSSQTKYPIVLVHGFIGFDNILGAVNYFYDIPGNLRKEGATVYVASVNPSQTTEFRGEELIQQMKQWAAKDGVKKFNLIGHSHGGPSVGYAGGTGRTRGAGRCAIPPAPCPRWSPRSPPWPPRTLAPRSPTNWPPPSPKAARSTAWPPAA